MADDGQLLAEKRVLREQRCSCSENRTKNDPDEIERKDRVPRGRLEAEDSSGACPNGPRWGESRLESAGMEFSGGTGQCLFLCTQAGGCLR
jgi:hypothetical protein